ncbi:MAG TPA: EamA family transporter [Vicinamibacterales bacterium]|nr:EamA family transporter [Vicinamibacterales bacterium]
MTWLAYAFISAIAAALTAILAKRGIENVPATLATAIRTIVIAVFAWVMVLGLGQQSALGSVPRRSWVYLILSGLTTGISWLAYFRALQLGPASRVAPIDKLSLPITVVLAVVLLGETLSWKIALGITLMTVGALLTLI